MAPEDDQDWWTKVINLNNEVSFDYFIGKRGQLKTKILFKMLELVIFSNNYVTVTKT